MKKEPSCDPIWKGLEEAVANGTAQLAAVDGLSVAGKTGTAFDGGGDFTHAWFAGWAPADNPRVVLSVFFERGKGATEAAPAAGAILGAWHRWNGSRPR
jgi:cell division protein FtsI/penicillin-binding protein 2